MPELRDRLQSALGSDFEIDRELGGGGMSHVLLAHDRALGRRIVVKVLPPEMGVGVSADRFKREIQLAAGLQHPHIVPLLAAGETDGLPYFTMPYVEGESLRARLARDDRLTIREAIGVLRDVAKALAYAHERGVVHRDIKPDNVLLSGGAAMVTDFGVAKALSTAREDTRAGSPAETLTVVGTSLGTPKYMAPEQGAADPNIDHRADIYSFGVMAYETLAGEPPFTSSSIQQLLVAHITQPPPPLAEKRRDVPPELATLVMRCLEKDPAARPQSAAEIVRVLDEVPTTSGSIAGVRAPAARRRRGLTMAAGIGAVAIVAIAGVLLVTRERGLDAAALDADRVVVIPFENQTGDASLEPIGKIAADWLTQGLSQTGLVQVVDPGTAIASGGAGRPGASRLTAAAERTGASRVITGTYYLLGDSVRLQGRMVDVRTNAVVFQLDPVVAPRANPTGGLDALRQRLLGAMAVRYNPQLSGWASTPRQPPTYEAYQAFVEAVSKQTQPGTAAERAALLERAVSLDSTYLTAWVWLANAYLNQGRAGKADSILARVRRDRAQLSAFDAALADLEYAAIHGDAEARLAASRKVALAAPGSEWRIALVEALIYANHPREALDTLAVMNPDQGMLKGTPVHAESRIQALLNLGEAKRAQEVIEETRQRFPGLADWNVFLIEAMIQQGKWDEVDRLTREIELMPRTANFIPRNALRAIAQEVRVHGDSVRSNRLLEKVLASYSSQPESLSKVSYRNGRAQTVFMLERWEDSRLLYDSLMTQVPGRPVEFVARLGIIDANTDHRAAAERASAEIAGRTTPYNRSEYTYWRARIAAQLRDTVQAIQLLKDSFSQGMSPASTHADVLFEPLHGNPDYEALVKPRG
jgi:TolB-like protein